MSRPRPTGRTVALAVLAAMASTADAGSAVAWLQGGDTNAPSSTPRRDGGARGRAGELDDLRARIVPEARAQADMRDLQEARDAADRAAAAERAGADDASGVAKQRQAPVESAGGGLDFRAGPPAADTEDIARRVRASKGEVILLHGGLEDGGDSARHTAVLAGLGGPEGAVFCRLAEEDGAGTASLASAGAAASPADDRAFFHGGYRVWDGGNDFADADDLAVFDGTKSGWDSCAGEACGDEAGLGARATSRKKTSSSRRSTSRRSSASSVSPGRRDEHVAVVTPHPIELGGVRQRALVVFGGRDESDARLDSAYALGLDDGAWRELRPKPPSLRKGAPVAQGPFDLPAVIRAAHEDTRAPYALARSGASAVVTDDNVMFVFGGFVVEGRLGFNVGELLALDLNENAFFYPEVSGDLPVRRNKHTAVLDAHGNMWLWGGSVWDHTGGSATYASTATHVADLSDPRRVAWRAVETKGSPPSQRRLHTSVIKDGVMYVIGGEDYHSKKFLQDVHALDLETLTWSQPATAGSAGGGRIRAAAVGLRVADPSAALEGCGEGAPSPAVTGELQPRNDKLVTALQESTAAVGKKKGKGNEGDAYDELFAAMLGTRSVVGDASAIRAGWVPEARRGAGTADGENAFAGDLGSGLLVESREMWELHLLADVPDMGLLELQADDLPEFQFQGRGETADDPRPDPREAPDADAGGWAREAGRGGRRSAFRTETEAVTETEAIVARAGAKEKVRERGARKRGATEDDRETFQEALDDLLDDLPRGEKMTVSARGGKEKEAATRGASRSAERRPRALPGSTEEAAAREAAEVHEAHRVARRDAAAVRAGGTVEPRFADPDPVDPIDPRSVAASADRSYRETVENDKREAAARESRLGVTAAAPAKRDAEEGASFVFDASGRVSRVASLGDAKRSVAPPETEAEDDAAELVGSEIVADVAREDVKSHDARVSAAAAEATRELVEASLGARETETRASRTPSPFSASRSSAVLRVLGGAAMLATVGVFGMRELATRLRLEHAAALGTKEELARFLTPDPGRFRDATPLARRESPKTTPASWQKAAAARWQSHFADAGSEDSAVDVCG